MDNIFAWVWVKWIDRAGEDAGAGVEACLGRSGGYGCAIHDSRHLRYDSVLSPSR